MSDLSKIISNSKAISEREAIIKPLQEEIDDLEINNNKLISQFLEGVMVKRKKYFLNGHSLKWICYTTIHRGEVPYEVSDLFHCEFRANKKGSIIFKEFLRPEELFEAFSHCDYYKELVRESAIKTVIDDK